MILKDKRIIITGTGRGLGRGIAKVCAREGAVLGLNYCQSKEQAEALKRELERDFQCDCQLLPFDISDQGAVSKSFDEFVARYERIDGLVNNAAVMRPGLFISQPIEVIQEQFNVNVMGTIHCAQAALPVMLGQKAGVILNISSVSALRPNRGQAVYAASKGAVESLTKALAVEYAKKNIRVLGLRPGPIATDMIAGTRTLGEKEILARVPLKKFGQVEDVAEMAAFLLSDKAKFLTGSIHSVDGGYLQG
ncbi:MAG: SDR family oxidoreductase [Planctomycetota bacterium]|nr:SDR family oxidoreductase [Planctomycetota bacterium]